MPLKQYVRDDRRIRAALAGGRFEIEEVTDPQRQPEGRRVTRHLGDNEARRLVADRDRDALAGLVGSSFAGPDAVIRRLVLELPAELAWADWEELLAPVADAEERIVVRGVASRPSYAARPLVVPLRVLHFTYGRPAVEEWVDWAIGYRGRESEISAVHARTATEPEMSAVLQRLRWPVADVIHITEPYRRETTAGWLDALERLVVIAQCRLLVLEPTDPEERTSLLLAAARIAGRGGPAVVVSAAGDGGFSVFYADLLHDKPLDVAVRALRQACLYAGRGREDALRVSTAGAELYQDLVVLRDTPFPPGAAAAIESFAAEWHGLEFADSEQEGLYPMTRALHRIRDAYPSETAAAEAIERHVTPALYQDDREIPAMPRRPLHRNTRYDLRVEVGTGPAGAAVARAQPLLFERQLWDEADDGVWLDVGVTGVGWDVIGEAEQRLFVPKAGASAPCWFGVRPNRIGAAALRFTLFHEGHVIQSFRLAAVVGDGEAMAPSAADASLAEVLTLGVEEVRDHTWRARLEFSTVATIEQSRRRPPRALAIVANDIAGQAVLSFKTAGEFHVHHPDGNIGKWVDKARALLEELTFNPATGNYRFGISDGDPNAATEARFVTDFPRLAKFGADLYHKLVPMATRANLPLLGGQSDTVQIAGILRDKVIPWALIYQGKYDPGPVEDDKGNLADHKVCTALLQGAHPDAFSQACGESAACLLHGDNLAARAARGDPPLLPITVACPGRLWGFRHRLELPPAQVPPDGTGTAAVDVIKAGSDAAAVLAVSPDLKAAQIHQNKLRKLVQKKRGWEVYEPTRKAVLLSALGRDNLAVVHLLSRANGGAKGPLPPELQYFDLRLQQLVEVNPSLLRDVTWSRNPLVLLNGCGTAGFSTEAVSQFIQAFIDERHAAAVLGTEASVSDFLASEFGHLFLSAFLKGSSAGDALLAARRSLLARFNPLGLSYTLYGMSELHLSD